MFANTKFVGPNGRVSVGGYNTAKAKQILYLCLSLLWVTSFIAPSQASIQNRSDAQAVDYLALGASLLKDGYVQRAKKVLDKVDVTPPNFDFGHYYTLKGILNHKLSYPTISNIFFNEAVNRGQDSPSIYIYVARNHWQRRQYQQVIDALDKGGEAALEIDQMYVIKAQAYKELGNMDKAWETLDAGIERFPEYARLYKQKFHYLVDLGFFQHAEIYIDQYLHQSDYSEADYLTVAYTLRQNSKYDMAARLLEGAYLKYPDSEKLMELLGQVYIDKEDYLAAALVFDWASIRNNKAALKAASLYLKAKEPVRALQLNRRIAAQDEKFRQRLGIDLMLEDYESVATMDDALRRYGLLDEDDVAYAVGFAHYVNRDYDQAKRYLKTIEDSQLFGKAAYIFQQIEKCEDDPLNCR